MRVLLRVIRIIILTGITIFIVMKLFNFSSLADQTKSIKAFEKEDLNTMPKSSLQQFDEFKEKAAQKRETQETEIKGDPREVEKKGTPDDIAKGNPVEAVKSETYFLTYDELKSLQKVSLGDKLFGMMILSKMKSNDIDTILALARGGITSSEGVELKNILDKALSPKEVEKIYKKLEHNVEKANEEKFASR